MHGEKLKKLTYRCFSYNSARLHSDLHAYVLARFFW